MKHTNLRFVVFASIAIALLLLLNFQHSFNEHYQAIIDSKRVDRSNEFHLNPTNTSLYTISREPINYPYVKTKPLDIRYFFTLLVENKNIVTNRYDELFFSSKRLAELAKWGNTIPTTTSITTAQELKKWWAEHEPTGVNVRDYKKYNSWEASLARYNNHIETTIDLLAENTNPSSWLELYGDIVNHLAYDQDKLRSVAQQLPESEKNRVLALSQDIIKNLHSKLNLYDPLTGPYPLEYSFANLRHANSYGSFTAYVDNIDLVRNKNTISLTLDGKPLRRDTSDSDINQTRSTLIYRDIQIHPTNSKLVLEAPQFPVPQQQEWTEEKISDTSYKYSLPIVPYKGHDRHIFKTTFKTPGDYKITLAQIYKDKYVNEEELQRKNKSLYERVKNMFPFTLIELAKSFFSGKQEEDVIILKSDILFDATHTATSSAMIYERPAQFTHKKLYTKNVLTIESPVQLTKAELPTVETFVIIEPQIFLQKSEFTELFANELEHRQNRLGLIPAVKEMLHPSSIIFSTVTNNFGLKASFLLSLLSIATAFLCCIYATLTIVYGKKNLWINTVTNQLIEKIQRVTSSVQRSFLNLTNRYRSLLLIIAATCILFQIGILNQYSEILALGTAGIWLIALHHYRVSSQLNTNIGIFLISLAVVYFVARINPTQFELPLMIRLSAWAFIFFCMATIQMFFEQNTQKKLQTPSEFYLYLTKGGIMEELKPLFIPFYNMVSPLVIKLYGPKPTKRGEWVRLYIKIGVTFLVAITFFVAMIFIYYL